MDYGYQLLRHVVQQVFGNFGAAARLTMILAMGPTLFLVATNPEVMAGAATSSDPETFENINWGMLMIGVIIGVIAWCWAAVAWHRFVLLEEFSDGLLPTWRGANVLSYFGRAVLVMLVVVGVTVAAGIGIGIVVAATGAVALAVVLGIGLVIGAAWVATRVGLILPAAAIGEPMRIKESWALTAPVSGQILLPIIVIALVAGLLSQAMVLIFGVGMVGAVATALVSWVQLLVNLAVMTTLYGNLVEGRQLN